jgi:ligand-binding sensor domain-containing protein/DNA-binding CsgD family transcriptional regulator
MKFVKLWLLPCLLLVRPLCLLPQENVLDVERITASAAPLRTEVQAVCLGSEGYLWIGSQNGLLRYDGYRVTPCRLEDGQAAADSDSSIRAIAQDSGGRLWLATGLGLVRYDPANGKAVRLRHDPRKSDSISCDDLTCLFISPRQPGILWIASANGDLDGLDLAHGRFSRHSHLIVGAFEPGRIHVINGDAGGFLWIGAANGLYRFQPLQGRWELCAPPATVSGSLGPFAARALLLQSGEEDVVWIGSESSGLFRYVPADGSWQSYRENDSGNGLPAGVAIRALARFPGEPRSLILGSDEGLFRFDTDNGRFSPVSLFINQADAQAGRCIRVIHADANGSYWIGSCQSGLDKWSPLRKKFHKYLPFPERKPRPLANWVTSLLELGGGEMLLTTYGGGMLVFDRERGTFKPLSLDSDRPQRRLNQFIVDSRFGRDGSLWLATAEGIARCTPAGRLLELFPVTHDKAEAETILLFSFIEDARGLIWVATDRGLVRLDPADGSLRRYRHERPVPGSLSHDRVNDILEDGAGSIWVATDDGLNRYQPGDDRFTVFRSDNAAPDGLGGSQVNSLRLDSLGRIWACTSASLDRIEKDGDRFVFRHFRMPGGSAGQNLFRMLVEESGNRFWVGTNAGLARFDADTGSFCYYDHRDGVEAEGLDEAFFGMRCRDGEIYFGGRDGFTRFRPDEIALNRHAPPVVVSGFYIFENREQAMAGGLGPSQRLSGGVVGGKVVRIEFSALDFTRPEKNQYAYRLEGLDRDWIYQGTERVVILEGLDIGIYTLWIRAANNEGVWNETGRTMLIRVIRAFHEKWLVPILAGLLLAGAAAFFVWSRRRSRRLQAAAIPGHLDAILEKFAISKREAEIVRLLLAGKSNQEIENELFIAMATVKIHVHNIFRKVKVKNRLQLLLRIQQEEKKRNGPPPA